MATEPSRGRSGAFFGRRAGKPLSKAQADAMGDVLARLRLDLERPAPVDLRTLFVPQVEDVTLEIGFGGGEHLLAEADLHPGAGYIGVEPFISGMAKVVAALALAPRNNIRLHDDDAAALLDWLPDASLAGIDLLYPDPWPKRRHWKRRFVNAANLDRFARLLRPGGIFRFASDIDHYVDWTLIRCRDHGAFDWTAACADDWRRPYAGWQGTRYEAKAVREGRAPAYLTFRRRG